MQDRLISLETAILAKKKGFDESVYAFYENKLINYTGPIYLSHTNYYGIISDMNNLSPNQKKKYNEDAVYSAPTQSLLQMWLREKHHIHVFCVGSPLYSPCIMFKNTNFWNQDDDLPYHMALEKGLKKALTIL